LQQSGCIPLPVLRRFEPELAWRAPDTFCTAQCRLILGIGMLPSGSNDCQVLRRGLPKPPHDAMGFIRYGLHVTRLSVSDRRRLLHTQSCSGIALRLPLPCGGSRLGSRNQTRRLSAHGAAGARSAVRTSARKPRRPSTLLDGEDLRPRANLSRKAATSRAG
jgi:hypothetical protein